MRRHVCGMMLLLGGVAACHRAPPAPPVADRAPTEAAPAAPAPAAPAPAVPAPEARPAPEKTEAPAAAPATSAAPPSDAPAKQAAPAEGSSAAEVLRRATELAWARREETADREEIPMSAWRSRAVPQMGTAPGDARTAPAPKPAPSKPAPAVPASAPATFCAPLRQEATEADCDAFKAQLATLQEGVGAFNPPKQMTRGIGQDVTLSLGSKQEAAETIASVGGNAAATVVIDAKLGRYMTATLTGGGFDITPSGPAQRDLGGGTEQSWTWRVTPRAEGDQRLQLVVSVEAQDAQGRRTTMRLSSRIIAVTVLVGSADRASDRLTLADRVLKQSTGLLGDATSWLKALAAMIAAAGVVWLAIRGFGKNKGGGAGG